MNLEQLHHIVETARLKSLARAAESLHISQSGLSQSITAFEKDIGYPIFKRSRLGAEVTPPGSRIIHLASEILELFEEMKSEAQNHIQMLNRKISLAGIPGVMGAFIQLAAHLKQHYPEMTIEISELGTLDSIKEIEEDRLDAAFIAMNHSLLVSLAPYSFQPISEGKMIIGVGKISSLATYSSISPEELKKQDFVLYNDDFVHWFIEDFERQYGKVNVLFSSNNADAVSRAVIEMTAVTVGHEYTFYEHPLVQQGEILPLVLDNFQQSPVAFGWLIGRKKRSPLLEECLDFFDQIRDNDGS
ncbi:LysR family transcriptional regulator [Paenibacillus sp. L3-i20]|uniref:LysR substrate-binding domain-containing protein n=1 Tax=Paenibacillus sp. L3-i20 TaxID=2905833 RepID=UPI001EDD49BC|nr:LysR family transcriptional regulator [Paenibacillus sp. L3-i20]GKU78011.1 LysR family transcriptional regulator [Paenibacillus sp. L3-i20]